MLALKPSCEHCDKTLNADSTEAMICSYECTFCQDCVENVLSNVCPNCGGGFEKRPVRPIASYIPGVSLLDQPPSEKKVYNPVNLEQHNKFNQHIKSIDPEKR